MDAGPGHNLKQQHRARAGSDATARRGDMVLY